MHAQFFQSCLTLCDAMTVARQAPLSMGLSRYEYWSGLPCPPPGDLPDPGIKTESLMSPALAGRFFPTEPPGKVLSMLYRGSIVHLRQSPAPNSSCTAPPRYFCYSNLYGIRQFLCRECFIQELIHERKQSSHSTQK